MTIAKKLRGTVFKTALASLATISTFAALPVTPAMAQSRAEKPSSEVVLSVGRGQLINLPGPMSDLFIANQDIADVQVKSSRQLYVFGKAGGETTLYASNSSGAIVYSATIRVGSNLDSIGQMLGLAMPNSKINVNTMNGLVLLTGTIAAPEDGATAEQLVKAFVGEKTQVVSRLQTATPLQVNLQVRIAEVSRTLVKALDGNFTTQDRTGGFLFGAGRGRAATTLNDMGGGTLNSLTDGPTTLGAIVNLFGLDVGLGFDLAENAGLVTTLSQPNLTALSGETADFLAGGEFPIPINQGLGQTTVEYRKYGVSLAYTPTVLANGRISMRVRPEVSELSSAGAVVLNGFQIPALTTRRAETTIELGSGQSFMIAGLLSNNVRSQIDKTPLLGDIPVLGNLFKSRDFRRGETELVIVVTPYLVKPVNANDIALPTDGLQAPTEPQQLLLNKETDGQSGANGQRPKPSAVMVQGNNPDFGSADAAPVSPAKAAHKETQTAAAPGFSFE